MTDEAPPETNKETRTFIIIGSIVFVALFFFLIFGVRHPKQAELKTMSYNYYKFEQIGGLWQTDIDLNGQVYQAIFRFNPEQVKDVYITGNASSFRFAREPVYITFEPNASSNDFKYLALAASELSLNLVRALNVTVVAACTENVTDPCANRPIVTCGDKDKNVMYLVPNPPTQITLDNRCATLSGNEMDLLKSVDRMLFQWYKIMK